MSVNTGHPHVDGEPGWQRLELGMEHQLCLAAGPGVVAGRPPAPPAQPPWVRDCPGPADDSLASNPRTFQVHVSPGWASVACPFHASLLPMSSIGLPNRQKEVQPRQPKGTDHSRCCKLTRAKVTRTHLPLCQEECEVRYSEHHTTVAEVTTLTDNFRRARLQEKV